MHWSVLELISDSLGVVQLQTPLRLADEFGLLFLLKGAIQKEGFYTCVQEMGG